MGNDDTLLLQAQGLDRQLGPRWLWRDLALQLQPGDRLALVAPSGAGKTLLLRSLALLDPLQQGELFLRGRTPAAWGLPVWRSRLIYLAQRPVLFPGTVRDNLQAVFQLAVHQQRHWQPETLAGWLESLGRDETFLDLDAERLSGGEAQLLNLLRALQLDPDILLLDEPTASLDPASTAAVEDLLAGWLEAGDRACVITSHDGEQLRRFGNRRLELAV
ncbi:ATP-binding cassette domain-containing protein [Synechococcus sp. CS-1328]|uniref:ABC transporter ATP-binding protein n=1 Tax=Synechococcus sp. CS-1328 TaxID=2847976 RepID=UPI00223B0FA1|nr:ATP-binding cassette domain-containing protein [Synechococcus sp. CS-1328]MCT0223886.1 ATP-binding cassette domain-containing protein [Synechococcus sp. CS-1328]